MTQEAGILSKGYFIFGLPYETEETMKKTIRFANRIPLNDISAFTLTPFPGSEMYDMQNNMGQLKKTLKK